MGALGILGHVPYSARPENMPTQGGNFQPKPICMITSVKRTESGVCVCVSSSVSENSENKMIDQRDRGPAEGETNEIKASSIE